MIQLRKWYLDCTTDDGRAVIAYHARARLGPLRVSYAALIRAGPEGTTTAATLRPGPGPSRKGDEIGWACPRLGLRGRWTAACPGLERELLRTEDGEVRWNCLAPWAACSVEIDGAAPLEGRGYVEVLEMTIPPWKLPIRELRWGRWLADDTSLVWIEWRGERPLTLILEQDREVPGDVGTDRVMLEDGRCLMLTPTRTIRDGCLSETVLDGIPRLKEAVRPSFLGTLEQKWLGHGVLEPSGRMGQAVYERVVFGQE